MFDRYLETGVLGYWFAGVPEKHEKPRNSFTAEILRDVICSSENPLFF